MQERRTLAHAFFVSLRRLHVGGMDLLSTLLIALALAMDAFAVAVGCSAYLRRVDIRQTFRLSFHFGLFQFLMPVIGWLAGSRFATLISGVDHWIALALLAGIGGKMLLAVRRGGETDLRREDVTRGWKLVGLSIATSIDALAVGLSLAMIGEEIIVPSVVIGLVAGAMTLAGMQIGSRAPASLARIMEGAGGVILILIGLRIVAEHTGMLG